MLTSQSFFVLKPPANTDTRATWDESVELGQVSCSLNSGHQRAGKRMTDLVVKLPLRAMKTDFVWTWYSECLLNSHALETLVRNHITGFETKPVEVIAGRVRDRDAFRELVITGWGGTASPRSGVRLHETCRECGLLVYSGVTNWSQLFDEQDWDGSDLFMVWPLPRFIIGTAKVASLIEENRLKGIELVPLVEMTSFSQSIAPGRASNWLSEDRLNELGIEHAIR
jgi:hypothetical protein